MNPTIGALMRLSDSTRMLADPDQDIRGRKVVDQEDNEIGRVADLLIDTDHHRVRLLCVEHGGLFGVGATPLYLPVESVARIAEDVVGIDRTRRAVAEAPHYDPELIDGDKYMTALYRHYGYAPWSYR